MSDEEHPSGLSQAEVWYRYTRYPPLLAKLATYGVVIGAIYLALSTIESVLAPVLFSLLLAYLLDPVIDRFEERGYSRTASILVFLGIGLSSVALYTLFLWPTLAHQVGRITENLPKLLDGFEHDLVPWIEANTGVDVPDTFSAAVGTYGDTLQAQIPTVTKAISAAATELVRRIGSVVASVVNLVMIPIFTFYFLRDFDRMKTDLAAYLPTANRAYYLDRIQKMDEVVGAWFRGQIEVALILAVLYALGLAIVFGWSGIGIGAGVGIGVLAGVLNVIPYFGFLIGFVASVLMTLLEWNGIGPLIGVLAVFAIVQGLEGYVITPRIVGEKVGLSPVVVIIALLIGGELLGLVGVLLALPVAGIVRVLLPDFVAYYRSTGLYRGSVDAGDARMGFIEAALAAEKDRAEG